VTDCGEQEINVVVVDVRDGLAQADGRVVGEAGGKVEHPAFPGRARKASCMQGVNGGFPVDCRCAGAVVDEVAEVVAAGEPCAVGDDETSGGLE
jgi:hypothetical protein